MVFLPLTLRQCSLGTEARRFEAGEIFAEKNYFLTEIKSVVRALSLRLPEKENGIYGKRLC